MKLFCVFFFHTYILQHSPLNLPDSKLASLFERIPLFLFYKVYTFTTESTILLQPFHVFNIYNNVHDTIPEYVGIHWYVRYLCAPHHTGSLRGLFFKIHEWVCASYQSMSYLLSGIASLDATCEAGWFYIFMRERMCYWVPMNVYVCVCLLAFCARLCVWLFAVSVLLKVDVTCLFFFLLFMYAHACVWVCVYFLLW